MPVNVACVDTKYLKTDNCCFSVPLKTGTIIIGIINLIGVLTLLIPINVTDSHDSTNTDLAGYKENLQKAINALRPLFLANAVIVSILILLMFVGIFRKKATFMIPWIVFTAIQLAGTTIAEICFLIIGESSLGIVITGVLGALLSFVVGVHLWKVTFSYYDELKSEEAA